jgi:hypothetical protein
LQTIGDLIHFGLTYALTVDMNFTFAMRTADTNATLADAREYGVTIGIVDKIARAGAAEILKGSADVVGQNGLCCDRKQSEKCSD